MDLYMLDKDKKPLINSIELDLSEMLGNMESAFEETQPVIVEEIKPIQKKAEIVQKKPLVDIDINCGGLIADLLEGAAEELLDDGLPVIIEKEKTIAEVAMSGDYKDHIFSMISDMTKELGEIVDEPIPTDNPVIFRDVISASQNEAFIKKNEEIQAYLDEAIGKLEEIEETPDVVDDVDDETEADMPKDNMSEYTAALKELSDLNEKTMNYNIENHDFNTFPEMRDHYKEFIKMVDVRLRRLSSLGGGGSNYSPNSGGGGSGSGEMYVSSDADNSATLGSDGGIYVFDHHLQADPINPVNTYDDDGVLIRIDYDGVSFKTFTYNDDGQLYQQYSNRYGVIETKTFIYNNDGNLINVIYT